LAGARAAKSDVLVFLDCHIEVNVNWLPPLVEPIAKNYRTCAIPYIDFIEANNYMYQKNTLSVRGVFSWKNLNYHLT
jgi:polypeptide N-acetylgalactosaminyltransferase